MRFPKVISSLLFALSVSLAGAQLACAEDNMQAVSFEVQHKREVFAHDFATKVLAIIQDQKKTFDDRKSVLRQAFSKSVDIDWIARFVIGQAWNKASDEQRARYTTLYKTYLTETYVSNFAENPDKRIRDIKIFGVNDVADTDFNVRTQMMLADSENLNVNYLVRENNGKYKVLDIAIENVSLISTHRSEFTRIANANGVDGVINELQHRINKVQAPITLSMNE